MLGHKIGKKSIIKIMELYWSPKLPLGTRKNVKVTAIKVGYDDLVNALRLWQPIYPFMDTEIVEITPEMAQEELDRLMKLKGKFNEVAWFYLESFVALYTKAVKHRLTICNLKDAKYYCSSCAMGRCDSYCTRCGSSFCRNCKSIEDTLCIKCAEVDLMKSLKCDENLEDNEEEEENTLEIFHDTCRMCGHTHHRSMLTLCAQEDCESMLCESCIKTSPKCLACVSLCDSSHSSQDEDTKSTREMWQDRLNHLPRGLTPELVESRLSKYTRFALEYKEHQDTLDHARELGLTRQTAWGRPRTGRVQKKKKRRKKMMGKLPDGPFDVKRGSRGMRRKKRTSVKSQKRPQGDLLTLVSKDQQKKRAAKTAWKRQASQVA